jgi:hypothetical protein
MLENAVYPHDALCQVKTDSDQHILHTGKVLTYNQYFDLLISAAITHDATFAHKDLD